MVLLLYRKGKLNTKYSMLSCGLVVIIIQVSITVLIGGRVLYRVESENFSKSFGQ